MGSISNSPPSFSLKSCISLFSGTLENAEGNPNLAETVGAFLCRKKHKQTPQTLCGCGGLQHSWAGRIFLSLCCPKALDLSIHLCHELRAASRVQQLIGGRRAPRNCGASHENFGNRGCLPCSYFSSRFSLPNPRPVDAVAVGDSRALGKCCQVFP